MSSSSSESSQHLKYPTSDSSTVLDLNTLIMRSTNPRRQAEDTSSSLDESTYELLGESTCSISDDEGNTASIASTDVHTPDDVSTFSDDDDDDDDDFERYTTESSQQLEQPSAYNAEPAFAHQIRSGEDSTLTEVPPHMEDSESSRLIKLNEEPKDDRDTIHAWKHIRIYDQEAEMPDVLKPYECSKIRLTVRAALSERYMPVSGAFRILYVGDYQEWAEKDISSQIGAALSTSPGPSRSIMVGGQMEPCGPVIDVHRCIDIKTLGQRRNPSQVILTLDDIHGTRFTFGPKQAVRSHGPAAFPDLVIFCYGTASNFAIEVERFCPVREAFQRHQVPCLDVAQVRPWNYLPSTTYDMKSLRLCVEGRHNDSTDYKLEEVLPIDHYTFCQLDPSQLNRHLAYITPPTNSRTEAQVWTLSSCLSNRIKKTMNGFSSPGKFTVMFMALTMMISMFLLKSGYSPVIGGTQFSVTTPSNTPSPTSASSSIAASSITVTDAAYTSMLSALHADPLIRKELTEVITHDVTSKLPKKLPKESKPTGFDIQTTGDHQFVLSPSKDFVNKKRKPQLQIQVSRHSKAIPIRYIRTVGGVYVVILEQEYPRGTFNVSIATHSKPLLQQTFKITLGYNKSKLTQIFDTIKQDIISAKDHIWNVSSSVTHEVHQRCMGWEDDTTTWKKKKTSRFNQNAPERSQALKKATQHRLRAGGALLSKAHRATWMEIRKATAPIRTSQAVLRARKNALRLRCKLEKAVGFSGKDDGEKEQTWACSKVQKKTQ